MNSNLLKLFILLIQLFCIINGINLCGDDWYKLSDKKCIMFINFGMGESNANNVCKDNTGDGLLQIDNNDEQDNLMKYLSQKGFKQGNAWLGYENAVKGNGTSLTFANWNEKQKDGPYKCVSISLSNGLWTGHNGTDCNNGTYRAICKKDFKMDLDLANLLKEIGDKLDIFEDKLDNLIPIGFIYTQLPKTKAPQELWNGTSMKFNDITDDYADLFFRAEGKMSGKFNEENLVIQENNGPKILGIKARAAIIKQPANVVYESGPAQDTKFDNSNINNKTINSYDIHPKNGSIYQIIIDMSQAELRPKNTAIKIWKRVA